MGLWGAYVLVSLCLYSLLLWPSLSSVAVFLPLSSLPCPTWDTPFISPKPITIFCVIDLNCCLKVWSVWGVVIVAHSRRQVWDSTASGDFLDTPHHGEFLSGGASFRVRPTCDLAPLSPGLFLSFPCHLPSFQSCPQKYKILFPLLYTEKSTLSPPF